MHETRSLSTEKERVFLVEIDLRGGRKKLSPSAQMARSVAGHRRSIEKEKDDKDKEGEDGGGVSPSLPEGSAASDFTVEESFIEFRELASSAGAEVVGEFVQRRTKLDPATLIGKGKLQEIAGAAASANADLILFDHELSPSQQRNIEHEVGRRVIDRTQLILDIFARHARTREGQLQVELAQLEYMLPRLAGRGVEMSQLGGGIGTRGPGETQLETDRRKIRRRIRHVQEQLESVRRVRGQQRQRREAVPVPVIALVGYTNAGKSTLFNAITQANVLESSRMFATLDPTLRSVILPSKRKIVVSDTVGFIRNLPHTLITSFRATLEEVQRASLILRVTDVTSPNRHDQEHQVAKVMIELEAQNKPQICILNKTDLLSPEQRAGLTNDAQTVYVSAAKNEGIGPLLETIDQALTENAVVQAKLRIPQHEGRLLAFLEGNTNIKARAYQDNFVELEVEATQSALRRLAAYIVPSPKKLRVAKAAPKKKSSVRIRR